MTHKITALAALVSLGALSAACGEKEVATEHIRAVVTSVDPEASAATGSLARDPSGESTADSATTAASDAASGKQPVLELPNGDTIHVRRAVVDFYRDRGYEPAWTDADEILPRGMGLLEAIGLAHTEGLDPERYHFSTAREMARLLGENAVADRELEYLGNLDLLLTENFARLSNDLAAGTMDPRKAGLDWQIARDSVDERELLQRVLGGENPRAVLGSIRPRVPYYDRMVRALHRLREVEKAGGWPTVPEGETIQPGDSDPRVVALRARLMAGDDPDETRLARGGLGSPRLFDDSLARAVEHFQTRHNLHEDGALGANTLAALNAPVGERIAKLKLNLDRWRWLPNELGEKFILVNIAGFELEVVDGDSAIESMNVVVGKTANRTPVFQDTLEYMVVNPYWNVPVSIVNEEILPRVERDPGYLARNNYELVSNGQGINPGWVSAAAIRRGGYGIRQKPGPDNALGNVKFLFPNSQNIYLHDTPADHLFSQKTRAFSHGCIRVERPDDLARTLLASLTDRDPGDYDSLRKASGEQWIPFDEKVPVHILYFTAWVERDGTIRFHEDIYERDRSLEAEQEEKMAPIRRRPIATDA